MARGGGGGGRGGGGRSSGGRHHHGTGPTYVPTTRLGRFIVRHEGILFSILIFAALLLHIGDNSTGTYNESKLSGFASQQYEQAFGETACYEDNLLLLFVVHEDRSDFSYITWVGDHIGDETFQYLKGEGTWLDDFLDRAIGQDYTLTLSADLARAVRGLADQIDSVTEYGSHTCTESHSDSPSYLSDLSDMELNTALIEDALGYFRQETLIPIVLVVADAQDVFG